MRYAIINLEKQVTRVIELADHEDITKRPVSKREGFSVNPVDDSVVVGDYYIEGRYISRDVYLSSVKASRIQSRIKQISIEELKARKIGEIKKARKHAEYSTFVDFLGYSVELDEKTQNRVFAAYVKAINNPAYSRRWKVSEREWLLLTAEHIIALGDLIELTINSLFEKEEILVNQIIDSEDKEFINNVAWL